VVEQADVVGSTTQILNAVLPEDAQTFIVATDNGILQPHAPARADQDADRGADRRQQRPPARAARIAHGWR
jgi:quinolinate synthase